MHPVLDSLFFPRKIYQAPTDTDVMIPTGDENISIRTYMFNKLYGTVLLFHGNGEVVSDYDYISDYYKNINLNLIVSDYRGYGHSSGTPTASSMVEDASVVLNFTLEFLSKHNFSDRLFVLGRSLGSVSAFELAEKHTHKIAGIVIESGFCSESPILELLGIDTDSIGFSDREGFNNLTKISAYKEPLLIIHAKNDEIVPYAQAKLMLEKSPSKSKKLLTISGAGHNNIYQFGASDYFRAIQSFTGTN